MTLKINPIVAILLIAGIIILIVALFRGCVNSKKDQIAIVDYKAQIKKSKEDSIEQIKEKLAYKDSMEFIQGQWELSKNKELALNEDLGKANDRISILLRKHVPIKPSLDSAFTTVDNSFINDCADCFEELKNGQQLVLKHKAEKDNQEQIMLSKIRTKDNRISFLEKSNDALGHTNSSLLSSAKEMQDKLKPRGRLYLSWGVLFQPLPKYAGAGLMYQNKRNMIIGGMWYYGDKGHMAQTTINLPLSLKFR